MISKILVILSLLTGALCYWSEAKALLDQPVKIFNHGGYLDESTGTIHFAYCSVTASNGVDKQKLVYATMDKNDKVEITPIKFDHDCKNVKIIPNTKLDDPMLIVEGKRDLSINDACSKDKPNACFDIYILTKNGDDWKEEVVNHRNGDPVERTSPHIVVGKDHKTYLFYIQKHSADNGGRIAFSIKNGANDQFSKEELINYPVDKDEGIIEVLSTINKAEETFRIFFIHNGKTLHLYTTNTKRWNIKSLGEANEQFTKFAVKNTDNSAIIVAISHIGKDSYYKTSEDAIVWSENFKFKELQHTMSTALITAYPTGNGFHLMTTNSEDNTCTHKFAIIKGEVLTSDDPFDNLKKREIKSLELFKITVDGQNRIKAFANILEEGKDASTIYYTYVDIIEPEAIKATNVRRFK